MRVVGGSFSFLSSSGKVQYFGILGGSGWYKVKKLTTCDVVVGSKCSLQDVFVPAESLIQYGLYFVPCLRDTLPLFFANSLRNITSSSFLCKR